MNNGITVGGLFIYPIKSCAGIALSEAAVETRGLRFDRRWMLVDKKMHFMTQRAFPAMALITAGVEHDSLVVAAPGMDTLRVSFQYTNREQPLYGTMKSKSDHTNRLSTRGSVRISILNAASSINRKIPYAESIRNMFITTSTQICPTDTHFLCYRKHHLHG